MAARKISRILVPLDGSKNSRRGLETAITLARGCGATITGLHSVSSQSHPEFAGAPDITDRMNAEVDGFLEEAKVLAAQNGIVFKGRKMAGNTGYNIVKLAHGRPGFDMIVIGSRGRSSAKEVFFGSVSNYVIHAARVPVVLVK